MRCSKVNNAPLPRLVMISLWKFCMYTHTYHCKGGEKDDMLAIRSGVAC